MAELDNIVSIQITRETTAVSTASFQIPLILSQHTNFSERYRVYTDIDAVADDFDSTDKAYVIAQKIFGQSGARVPSVVIGRRQVDEVDGSIAAVSNNTAYSVTINGTAFSFTSDGTALATEIVAGLKAAFDAAPISGITFTDNLDGTFSVAVTTPSTAWSITSSANVTLAHVTPTETWVEALDAVTNVNDTWYALVAETHVQADVEALAAAIQSRRKIYGTSTQDATVPTSGTTDIASVLDAQNYGRTFVVYLPTADTQYPEAAWIGSQLAYTPGSNDWDFKRGTGVTVSGLTDSQRAFLRGKNCNMFTTVAGVDIFQDGNMADGRPIDEQIIVDWTYARLQESIFFRLINSLKIPMTQAGLVIVENEIRSVLAQGEANGAFDRGWTVQTPNVLDIPANLRAQRTAGTFVFRARLAGSIRRIVIEGFLNI